MAQEASVPAEVAGLVHRAIGAFKANRLAEAVAAMERALAHSMPEATGRDICYLLGDWCARNGDLARARRHLMRGLVLVPGDVRTRLSLAELAPADKSALGLRELLARVRRDKSADSALALSRILLQRGQVKRSVAFARLGNARERKARGISRETILQRWNENKKRLANLAPHWRNREWHPGDRDQVGNVFICGVPRSGSTLLELMLLSMDGVASVGESPEIQEYLVAGLSGKAEPRLKVPGRATKFVINKMLDNVYIADFILAKIPNSRILIINRNPQSVFFSNYVQKYESAWDICYEDSTLADFIEDVRARSQQLAIRYPGRVMVVEYEQLAEDPHWTFRKIASLVGMKRARFKGKHVRAETVHTASKLSVRQPLRADMNRKYLRAADFMPYVRKRFG